MSPHAAAGASRAPLRSVVSRQRLQHGDDGAGIGPFAKRSGGAFEVQSCFEDSSRRGTLAGNRGVMALPDALQSRIDIAPRNARADIDPREHFRRAEQSVAAIREAQEPVPIFKPPQPLVERPDFGKDGAPAQQRRAPATGTAEQLAAAKGAGSPIG